MAYEQLMSSVGGVPFILADLRERATKTGTVTPTPTPTPTPGADLVLSSNPGSSVTTVAGPIASLAPTNTNAAANFIEARLSGTRTDGAAVSAGLLPDGSGPRALRINPGDPTRWEGGSRRSDGTWDANSFPPFAPFPDGAQPVIGDKLRADRTANEIILSVIKADGTAYELHREGAVAGNPYLGQYVALAASTGVTYSDVTYGEYNPSLAVLDPDFDPFVRALNIDVAYSNPAGSPRDYAEISINGGAWQRARNSANPTPGRATVSLDVLSADLSGTVSGRVRWHDNPSVFASFKFEAVIPFAGYFGMNMSAQDTQSLNDIGGFQTQASNSERAILGSIAFLNGFGDHPSSINGANSTVQRDFAGGIGVNTRGITHYRFFREFKADPVSIGDYEMYMAPGVVVTQDTFAYLPNFAYDQSTGRITFSLTKTVTNTIFGLHVQVNTIPAGTLLNPTFRKIGAQGKYNMAQVATVRTMATMQRNMDGSGINNANNNTRTLTALPKRTLANSGPAQFQGDIEFAKIAGFKRYLAINSHIDDETYVKAHADYVAANWPVNLPVDVSNFNEIWNFIFGHFMDLHLEGVRRGYGPLSATLTNATPMTVLDETGNKLLGGGVFTACDANGVVQPDGNTHLKTTRALAQGDKFVKNVGGIRLFGAKVAIPANTVTTELRIRDSLDPNYEELQPDAWVNRAAQRYASTLAKRNILIWKASFAAVGRPAPKFLIEGRVGGAGYAFAMLDWDNLYEHIDYNTSGPYISGGFSFDYMDWNRADIWDAQAKQLIATNDYTAAIELIIPRAIPKLREMGAEMRRQQEIQRAYNVSKFGVEGRDRIGQYFYEWGDHFGYVPSNWPDDGKARAFWRTFRAHPLYYTFFMAYMGEVGRIGAPAHWYRGSVDGSDSFSMFRSTADTDTSGMLGSNQRYRAIKDTKALVDAAVAQYGQG